MSNQLVIPFRKSAPAPIRQSLRAYIEAKHPETHPDAFNWDITQWEALRKEAVSSEVHQSRLEKAIAYHAQLTFILTKLPPDVGLPFTYEPLFPSSYGGAPSTMNNILFERVSHVQNIAALFCHLASAEQRSSVEDIKRALQYFIKAAGTLSYLISTALPLFLRSLEESNTPVPPDFDKSFLKALQLLMLAQAQECAWQKAAMDSVRNSLIAKLASQVSTYYAQARSAVEESRAASSNFPREWLAHIEAKQYHFEAAAQYRQSLQDSDDGKYGIQIARLNIALEAIKKAASAARKGGASPAVQSDIKSLLDQLEPAESRAQRDNDLIYHHDIPPSSSTPSIVPLSLVQMAVPPGLEKPAAVLSDGQIFGGLEAWGIRRACELYVDRRDTWIHDELVEGVHELDVKSSRTLNSVNLPSALDALSQPIGLPPSLIQKANEVRQEDGANRVERMLDDIPTGASRCRRIIDEALDILDEEAVEDEDYREAYAPHLEKWSRPPSSEANVEFTQKAQQYHALLDRAAQSDKLLKTRWAEIARTVALFGQDQAKLEAAIPKTTFAASDPPSRTASETQIHARKLRKLLDELEDLSLARQSIVSQAKRLAATDDIKPRILRQAATMDNGDGDSTWREIDPVKFEGAIEEGLSKYERFSDDVRENGEKLDALLEEIKKQNQVFLQSRKDDPRIKEREQALQTLDVAHQRYREITKDLEEGLTFYNNLATQLTGFREAAKAWAQGRRDEMKWISDSLNSQPHVLPPDPSEELSQPSQPPPPLQPATPEVDYFPEPEPLEYSEPVPVPTTRTRKTTKTTKKAGTKATPTRTTRSTRSATTATAPEVEDETDAPVPPPMATPRRPIAFDLPNPNSPAWEASVMPDAPTTPLKTKGKARKKELV